MKRVALMATLSATFLVVAPVVAEPASARFKLGTQRAASFMRTALLRHPNLSFQSAYARKVRCNKRRSAIRLKCKMNWVIGDLSFRGKGTIWVTFPGHRPFWNYSYQVIGTNEYCAITGGEGCARTYVVR